MTEPTPPKYLRQNMPPYCPGCNRPMRAETNRKLKGEAESNETVYYCDNDHCLAPRRGIKKARPLNPEWLKRQTDSV